MVCYNIATGQPHEAELDIDVLDKMLDNRKVFDEKSFGANAIPA